MTTKYDFKERPPWVIPWHKKTPYRWMLIPAVRWLLTPVACIAAWIAALIVGVILYLFAQSFCPANQMVSGRCVASWWETVKFFIGCFTAGLSAICVVAAGFFAAPAARAKVARIVFYIVSVPIVCLAIGSLLLHMKPDWESLALSVSMIGPGLITVVLLTRSRFAKPVLVYDSSCPNCEYNLTGNVSGVCPECGLPIPLEIQARVAPTGESD
jgi:hypothetical protein